MGLEGLVFVPSKELVRTVIKESPVSLYAKIQFYFQTEKIQEGVGEQVTGCLHALDFDAAIGMTPLEFAHRDGTMPAFSDELWKCVVPFRNADSKLYTRLVMGELYEQVARQPIVLEYGEVCAFNDKIIAYPLRQPKPIPPTPGWVRSIAIEPSRY